MTTNQTTTTESDEQCHGRCATCSEYLFESENYAEHEKCTDCSARLCDDCMHDDMYVRCADCIEEFHDGELDDDDE